MTKEKLKKEAEEWLSITDNHLNDERTHFLSESEYAEQAYLAGAEPREKRIAELEKENAELRKVAEFQQSSNMETHLENKKLKEGLAVGSMWNKHLNSQNKALEEERDKYRNMTFDKDEQLTKAKEIIKTILGFMQTFGYSPSMDKFVTEAEQFLSEVEK